MTTFPRSIAVAIQARDRRLIDRVETLDLFPNLFPRIAVDQKALGLDGSESEKSEKGSVKDGLLPK